MGSWHKNARKRRQVAKHIERKSRLSAVSSPILRRAIARLTLHHGSHLYSSMTWTCSCGGKNKTLHRWCGKCWKERPAEATDKNKKDKKEKERDASQSNKPPWVKEKEERAAGGQEQGDRPSRSQSRGRLLKDLQNASASSDLPEHLRQKSQALAREMKQQEDDSRPLHEQIVRL